MKAPATTNDVHRYTAWCAQALDGFTGMLSQYALGAVLIGRKPGAAHLDAAIEAEWDSIVGVLHKRLQRSVY